MDNAVAESLFASLQTELLDRDAWPTRRKLRTAIFEYIEALYTSLKAAFDPGVSCSTRIRRKVAHRAETTRSSLKTKA